MTAPLITLVPSGASISRFSFVAKLNLILLIMIDSNEKCRVMLKQIVRIIKIQKMLLTLNTILGPLTLFIRNRLCK